MNASDFYVVPGLKRRCEDWLIQSLDTTNMVDRLILGGFPIYLHTYKCHMFDYPHFPSFQETPTLRTGYGGWPRRCWWRIPRSWS